MSILENLDTIPHHPMLEEVSQILCTMTQNTDPKFFRVLTAYYFGKMAASMGAKIDAPIFLDTIPANVYSICLGTSGFGKGHSTHIMEQQFMKGFERKFKQDTFMTLADQNLWKLAIERAAMNGTEEQAERDKLDGQFRRAGPVPFTFDSGTPAAIKQVREKLLLASCGAINLQVDEIGSNFMNSIDVLTVFLELYEHGIVKQKLIKNTADNERGEDVDGKTPANALLMGTPTALLDSGGIEDAFYLALDTGLARRSLFGWGEQDASKSIMDAQARMDRLLNQVTSKPSQTLATHFTNLAEYTKHGWTMTMDQQVTLDFLQYQIDCETRAAEFGEYDELRRNEMKNRYSKALKLAGTMAFVDESLEVTPEHYAAAVKLVEESGVSFEKVLNREQGYVKLAKYLAEQKSEQTHADLNQALPFYSTSNSRRQELMQLAVAWGVKNNIIIRKTFDEGVEFYSGESLERTDLQNMKLSYSHHVAYDYSENDPPIPFEHLHEVTTMGGLHWANHAFEGGHRMEDKAIPGFNMIVVDVDGNASLDFVHDAMSEFTFLTSTTKRHGPSEHRFRLILPMEYYLKLDQEDYHEFMNNVLGWLPFESDLGARQRSKKWESFPGQHHYNEGLLLNPLKFIPKTARNEQYQKDVAALGSLDNLERWFAERMVTGSRNNQMIKFALALVDSGMTFADVQTSVLNFNAKLSNPLDVSELQSTVLVTAAQKCAMRP